MARIDVRVLVLVPLLMSVAACGDEEPPAASPPSATAAPAPSTPEPTDSVYEEEDAEPTAEAGDLSDEAQAYLDQALAVELGELAVAPAAAAGQRRETLDKLPDDPSGVLAALKDYRWLSPEARDLYQQAVTASR